MPDINIDGASITGLTIDGVDITEVTIDGAVAWTATQVIAETGRVRVDSTIDDTTAATTVGSVTFGTSYSNPIVVAYMAEGYGTQTVGTRVRNITSTGCEIFMEEPDDGDHGANDLHYIVCEAGRWETPEGITIEAGTHASTNVRSGTSTTAGDAISFSSAFPTTPAVLHHLNSYNNGAFMGSQVNSASTTGFNTSMEPMQTGNTSTGEDIGWIAIETGAGTLNGYTFECNYASDGTTDGFDDTAHNITYSQTYSVVPDVVISGQTMNGTDGYIAQASGTTSTAADVWAMEDQISDTERGHADETFGWFVIDPGAVIIA